MPIPVTPSVISELAFAVTTDVMNRKQTIAIDRKAMPLADLLWGKRKKDAGQAGSATKVNLKTEGEHQIQGWNRRDVLGFQELSVGLTLQYEFYNIHHGLEIVHTDLLDAGYLVQYNEGRNRSFAKKNSKDEVNRLANIFEEKIETDYDNFMIDIDRMLHTNSDANLPPSLAELVSITPTTGTIGGKDRATNPLLQNVATTGLTVTAGGTLFTGLKSAQRTANLYGRGRSARVDRMFAGSAFIDGVLAYRAANGLSVNANMAKLGSVDLSISDNGIFWDGIAIEFDPTLDALQASGVADGGVPWNKRCYGLASKALEIRCPSGMDLQLSAPADPPDQRFTRLSIDTRMAFVDTIPNAHFVVAIS